jgi:biopolymer transport protein ExbD
MAQIDTGGGAPKRELNREMPLVPFIDFLLCLVSFLLITAVWSQNARLDATANAPAAAECCKPEEQPKRLHVDVRDSKFVLSWRQGETVLAQEDIEKKPLRLAGDQPAFPELAARVREEWQRSGVHRAPEDAKRDVAVVHSSNTLAFGELAGVLDAIHSARREQSFGGKTEQVPAFAVSFAVN